MTDAPAEQRLAPPAPGTFVSRSPIELAAALAMAVMTTVRGKPESVRIALAGLLGGGHLLVEDLPGTGKTLLAKSIAAAMGGHFGRVQCTPDLLPTDITGTSVYHPNDGSWEFRPGPLFANVVLVDEINRASPRTQAALLEPMEEHQTTVDGRTYGLPRPFVCIATQNPFGQIGTFPLPESQLDRFSVVLTMGVPDRDSEREIITGRGGVDVLANIVAVTTPDEVAETIAAIRHIHCAEPVIEYLLDLTEATRADPGLSVGASPRASTSLLNVSRAHAVLCGRDYLTPADVQAMLRPAYAHRVSVDGRVDTFTARRILESVLARCPVPRPSPRRGTDLPRGARKRSFSIAPTPLGLTMILALQIAAFVVRTAADPLVAGMVWAFGATIIGVGVLWPIVTGFTIGAEIRSAPRDGTAGDDLDVEITLRGASCDASIRWASGDSPTWSAASVPGAGPLAIEHVARGVFERLVLEVRTSAPVGLVRVRRSLVLELPREIFVAPRPNLVDWQPRRAASLDAEHPAAPTQHRGDVVRSVRPYVPGDPAHMVHWPSSAHSGSLVVREYEPPTEVAECLVVDLGTEADPERVEHAVSDAAGLVLAIRRRGGRVALCTCGNGVATTTVVERDVDAARQLAAAGPGTPGTPPVGWPVIEVRP